MADFLSADWIEALDAAARAAKLPEAVAAVSITVEQVVRDSPDGEACYHLRIEDGRARVWVFLELVQLEEIGSFKRTDGSPGVADFLLEIAYDLEEIGEGKTSAEELEPEPLPVKTQGEVLSGETAIGLVQLLQLRGY